MKAVEAAFNQEKALVGAFSVIVQPVVEPMDHFTALISTFLKGCFEEKCSLDRWTIAHTTTMLCAGWQMGTLANTISSSLANCAIATLLLSSPRHLNVPFICPKMIVTWCRCQIMSSHFPRKSAQQRLFGFLSK